MRLGLLSTMALFSCLPVIGGPPVWDQLSLPKWRDVLAHLQTPPSTAGVALWWGWDGPVNQAVIEHDLDKFKSLGFSSVMIEPGYGMASPYLSSGWFELMRTAVAEAKRRDMHIWIVDEGKYPSGFAGGKFSSERPDLRMQALVVAEKIDVQAGGVVTRTLNPDTVGVVAVNAADGTTRRVALNGTELRWTAPEGKWQLLVVGHQFRTSQTRSVNNPTRGKDTTASLFDYLNADATRQFLEFTHKQYKKYVGDEFGRTVLGFRGDEPDFAYTPWTPSILDTFKREKGYDIRPYLASFFAPHLDAETQRAKADYWDVWSRLFRDNFFKIQADWCAANGLAYRVHLNHEDMMMQLVKSEGDFFRDMRYVQIPGIDAIWHQIWMDNVADFPKLASSAAHLYGRARSFTESFAAYRPTPDVTQAKWITDEQFVRGINDLEIMFYPSSANGERKPGGFIGSDQFPGFVEYAKRASYLLSSGQPTASVGVYFPTSSMWLGDSAANDLTLKVTKKLLETQRDFDYIDDDSLATLLKVKNGRLENLSGSSYQTILVPGAQLISEGAMSRLQQFAKAGGHVVFLGCTPKLVSSTSILQAKEVSDFGWARFEPSGDVNLPPSDVEFGTPTPSVKYLHRRFQDGELYFFFNESNQSQNIAATVSGKGSAQAWDGRSGDVKKLFTRANGGKVNLDLELQPYQSQFIFIGTDTSH